MIDCFNYQCLCRGVNEGKPPYKCECVACPNRVTESHIIMSNRTLVQEEIKYLIVYIKYNLVSCVYCVYLYMDLIRYARRNGMNWKYEAIEKLKEYSAKKQSLKSIPEEMARLESAMQSIRSATADGTPVSGGGSGREDMMLSNIVHREELARSLEQAKKWVSLVDSGLESLSADEKKILSRFYISPARGNVDALCEELGVEKAQVYRRRDSALRHFTLCLYGQTES